MSVVLAHLYIGHFYHAPPPLDLIWVESNIITNFNDIKYFYVACMAGITDDDLIIIILSPSL